MSNFTEHLENLAEGYAEFLPDTADLSATNVLLRGQIPEIADRAAQLQFAHEVCALFGEKFVLSSTALENLWRFLDALPIDVALAALSLTTDFHPVLLQYETKLFAKLGD